MFVVELLDLMESTKVKHYVPSHLLRILYFAFIYPIIVYSISVWGATSQGKLQRILILQKKSIRTIAKKPQREHALPLFRTYNLLCIDQVFKYIVSMHMHNLLYDNRRNQYPDVSYQRFREIHNHETRNNDKLVPRKCRTDIGKMSIFYTAPTVWNELPREITSERNCKKFLNTVREHYVQMYI